MFLPPPQFLLVTLASNVVARICFVGELMAENQQMGRLIGMSPARIRVRAERILTGARAQRAGCIVGGAHFGGLGRSWEMRILLRESVSSCRCALDKAYVQKCSEQRLQRGPGKRA